MKDNLFNLILVCGILMLQPCSCFSSGLDSDQLLPDLNGSPEKNNSIQLIRNATMKINYAGMIFLTDPMFSDKGAIRSFAGVASNPVVDLPISVDDIMFGVERVIVSHLHPDHFDDAAFEQISKEMPIICSPEIESQIAKEGFLNIFPVEKSQIVRGISITRVGGKHGKGKILEHMGEVSGFVFQASGEPTVYWVGDSIWCEDVEATIKLYKPEIIITHSGGATIPGYEPIVMDAQQTLTVAGVSPNSKIIAVHMEALDHCMTKRSQLRELTENASMPASQILIPEDGEIISF